MFLFAAVLIGCVSALKNTKAPNEPTTKEQAKTSTEQLKQEQTAQKPSNEELKTLLATPPPLNITHPQGKVPKPLPNPLLIRWKRNR